MNLICKDNPTIAKSFRFLNDLRNYALTKYYINFLFIKIFNVDD